MGGGDFVVKLLKKAESPPNWRELADSRSERSKSTDSQPVQGLPELFDRASSGLTTMRGLMFVLNAGSGYLNVDISYH